MENSIRLSVIMPCYKGEEFIQDAIRETVGTISQFENNFEVIVVIDGFVDNAFEKAKKLTAEYNNLKIIGYKENKGKGYAIQHGLLHSLGKLVAFLDSDLDYDPKTLMSFIRIAEDHDVDFVIGNRRDKRSTFSYPFVRRVSSWGFNIYVNILFPELKLSDTQAGIKLMRRDSANKIFEHIKHFEGTHGYVFDICLLVTARRLGFKIIEAPCVFHMKSSTIGTGKKFYQLIYTMGREVFEFKKNI